MVLAMMVTLTVSVAVFSMTPVYTASATLLIEAEKVNAVSIEEIYGLDSSRSEYFHTQYEILRSRRLAEKVIDRLDLANHPEFQPSNKPSLVTDFVQVVKGEINQFVPREEEVATPLSEIEMAKREKLILDVLGRTTVTPIPKTQLVRISFNARDPNLAALYANTLGEIYIESYLEDKMGMTQKASEWIRDRLDALRIKLRESEANLQQFREDNQLVDAEGATPLVSQELNQITAQLNRAREKRAEAQSVLRLIESRAGQNPDSLLAMPEVSKHQLIQQIKKAETDAENVVAELSKRYGPKHNKMISALARLEEVRASLNRRVEALVEGVEQEYKAALANEEALKLELAQAKERFQGVSRAETKYRELAREVETNSHLYDTFLTRLKETGAVGDFQSAHARFNDRAVAPIKPTKPNKKMLIALAFVLSIMMGVVLAFVLNALSDTIVTAEDVEQHLAQRVIGVVPQEKVKGKKDLPVHTFFDAKAQRFSEAWRTLRTGYVLSHMENPARVLSVTSTIPGEGKTTTSINLSFALAQVERVLLIEADMRRPTVGKRFGIPNYQPGLANVITGTHSLEQCIYHDEQSNLDILVSGASVPNPLELLTQDGFQKLVEELSEQYDRIVIDTPPAHVVSDAMVVARVADSMLYVVKAGLVRRKVINEALATLQGLKTRIDGVVLNGMSVKAHQQHYGYSYDGYYSTNNDELPKGGEGNKAA
ncbi:exopolysaccharide regulatory tyrosine autokinase VpsO [Corallincola platygyrae]